MKLSHLAETLIGSEIVKLGNQINERIRGGEKIYNYTIGDFNPEIFPIPERLKELIIKAYQENHTNYPAAEGIKDLRISISEFLKNNAGLDFGVDEIQVSCGGRPLIYAAYRAIVDKGEKVVYTVPSWNNNHYTHFVEGEHVIVETKPENRFMPTVEDLKPHLKGASLLALCSPLNPTGTAFTEQELAAICDMVLEENYSRGEYDKKLYVLYDQIYWMLTFGATKHVNPVSIRPEMKNYTIFIDGISKSFSATGVRVGWAMGPAAIMVKIRSILSHVGAWSPMAEQVATANFLKEESEVAAFTQALKSGLHERLFSIYAAIKNLKEEGHPIDIVEPQGAMYLTIKMDLVGKTTTEEKMLEFQEEVSQYILDNAKLAIVPFSSFGAPKNSPWYRMSVGTCKMEDIPEMINKLKQALLSLM